MQLSVSHSSQAKNISKFIKPDALTLIPLPLRGDIVRLIQSFVRKIANERKSLNYYKKKSNAYHELLNEYGLLGHGNIKNEASSESTKYRRLKNIDKFIKYHDQTVSDVIDLASAYVLRGIKRNETSHDIIRDEITKQCIRNQNTVVKQLNNDRDYQARIFFQGFIQGWSKKDYREFNKVV